MKQDLIERYIYAATKRLPRKQREDVAQELQSLVDDMLLERCGERNPEEKDVRIVLTELGTPQELSEKYNEDGDKCLIGQPYYTTYKFVLKIVLSAAAVGLTLSSLILQLLEPKGWLEMIGSWLAMLYNGALESFAIVTLLFAFFYRKGIQLTEPFNFDDLPPVPKKSQEIPKWESIAGIVICVIVMVLFLFIPEIFSAYIEGKLVSLFDIQTVKNTWYIILLFGICGIARETIQLLEGRYNQKVLTTALVTNALSATLSIWWLQGFQLINPVFLTNLETIFFGENNIVLSMFAHMDLFFLGVMLFALLLDTIDVTVKTLRK